MGQVSTGEAESEAPTDASAVLQRWRNGVRIEHIAHSRAASRFDTMGRALGLAVVVLTAVVGTSLFSTIESSPSTTLKIVAGVLAFAASAVAALQTFLGYAERAASHRDAAAKYGSLRRRIEALDAFPAADLSAALDELETRWDDIEASQPTVPQRLHDFARAQVLGAGNRSHDARS